MSSFVHLHVHSEYSLLDGACRVDDLCKVSVNDGAPGVALTDHGVMFGAMEFYYAARDFKLTPIVGCEAYIAPRGRFDRSARDEAHVTLLAADVVGYRNLVALISKGFLEGYYYKPRIDMDLLAKHHDGLIVLSGCMSSLCAQPLLRNDYAASKAAAQSFVDIFGDRFYIEVMRHGIPEQDVVNDGLIKLARDMKLPLVATNDSHYLRRGDAQAHDVLLCIGTGKTVQDTSRMKFMTDEFYVKSAAEMRELFKDVPDACDNTLEIVKRIDIKIPEKQFNIPLYPVPQEPVSAAVAEPQAAAVPAGLELFAFSAEEAKGVETAPAGKTAEQYLREICHAGLIERYGEERAASDTALRERLEYELGVINTMGFPSYFLIVWDFIKYARDNDIPVGPGRGSAVGSLVSYVLKITDLDPIKFNLIFERFLNPDRISMPDIDTDFCVERRDEVIKYVTEKYGSERVAQIVTFGTMAARAAVRDAGRALGVPLGDVDRVAKLIPSGPGGLSIDQALQNIPELKMLFDGSPQIRQLLETARSIEGLARHASTHAAGVVISKDPLVDVAPLIKLGEDDVNTQYDMGWVERIGLLKMDFLGLRNLTVMNNAVQEIRRTGKPDFDLANIPDDDSKTFEMLSRGETTGVFQLESDGMRRVVTELRPNTLDDIVALVALYRPGPMDWIPLYISNKHGRTKPKYLHPKLEPILAPTYAVACLRAGTPIWYPDGKTLPIEKVTAGDEILTFDRGAVRPARVGAVVPSGKKKLLRITLSTGTTIECSEDHRFPTPGGDFEARELRVNRAVARGTSYAYSEPRSILFESWVRLESATGPIGDGRAGADPESERIAVLRGLWKSDGTFGRKMHFRSTSPQRIETVARLLSSLKIAYYVRPTAVYVTDASRFSELIGGPLLPSKRVAVRAKRAMPISATASSERPDRDGAPFAAERRKDSRLDAARRITHDAYLRKIPGFWNAHATTYEELYLGPTRPVFIEAIEAIESDDCVDISMHDQDVPYFIANGVVTHNCYQEQVMQIARDIAGFSMGQADELRKVMGKKQKEKIPVYREKFVKGAVATSGIDEKLAEEIFQFVEPFAGYGFNKCAHGSTEIELPDGTRTRLSAAYRNSPAEIMAMWPDGQIRPHKVARIVRTGRKALLRVRTASGKSIEVTAEHRLLTTEGYREVGRMQVGTELIVAPDRAAWRAQTFDSGYRRRSIASNGMWCASTPERDMCEWLARRGIAFEMHRGLGNGRMCDFYFEGIYWEMDGLDRNPAYFAAKYGDLPYVVVTPEDFKATVSRHLQLEHATNGDAIVSIGPCGEAMTYDVEMAPDGPLNYIANRIVSHNSHAVAYGWISYQTAFLKANHPRQYFAALMTSVKDKTEKLVEYIDESKKYGVSVLPPDVNESRIDFTVVGDDIRFGLAAIKGVGEGAVRAIIDAREKDGRFSEIFEFVKRLDSKQVNRKVLEALVKCGALDSLAGNRAQKLDAIDVAIDLSARAARDRESGQVSLFGLTEAAHEVLAPQLKMLAPPPLLEMLGWEKETLGIFVSGHPLADVADALARAGAVAVKDLRAQEDDAFVTIAGMVTSVRRTLTKQQQQMLYAQVEDMTGSVECIVFPKSYPQLQAAFVADAIVTIKGRVRFRERRGAAAVGDDAPVEMSISVNEVKAFERREAPPAAKGWHLIATSRAQIDALARLLDESPGLVPVVLHVADESEQMMRGISNAIYVRRELESIFGGAGVWEGPVEARRNGHGNGAVHA